MHGNSSLRTAPGLCLLALAALAGCGGGGSAPAPDEVRARTATDGPLAAARVPASYSARFIHPPFGPFGAIRAARPIDMRGRFIGAYGFNQQEHAYFDDAASSVALTDPSREFNSQALALGETGWVAGVIDYAFGGGIVPRAFAWSRNSGTIEITAGLSGFAWSRALSATDSGLIGGDLCAVLGQANGHDFDSCNEAFIWDSSDRSIRRYPQFRVSSMNEAGTMVGISSAPNCPDGLALMQRDGSLRALGLGVPVVGPDQGRDAPFVADDESVFVQATAGNGDLKPGAIVVTRDGARNIGLGVAAPPGVTPSFEFNDLIYAHRSGQHAVGTDFVTYAGAQGQDVHSETGFYWNAADGATAIRVGTAISQPKAVNKDGIVVGTVVEPDPTQQRVAAAFVWSRTSGGVLLETLVTNVPGLQLREAWAIGDGGHIIASSQDGGFVLLTPER